MEGEDPEESDQGEDEENSEEEPRSQEEAGVAQRIENRQQYLQMCQSSAQILQLLSHIVPGVTISGQVMELESLSEDSEGTTSESADSPANSDDNTGCVLWAEPLMSCKLLPTWRPCCDAVRRLPPGVTPADVKRQREALGRGSYQMGSGQTGSDPMGSDQMGLGRVRFDQMGFGGMGLRPGQAENHSSSMGRGWRQGLPQQSNARTGLAVVDTSTQTLIRRGESSNPQSSQGAPSSTQLDRTRAAFTDAMSKISMAADTIKQARSVLASIRTSGQVNNNNNPEGTSTADHDQDSPGTSHTQKETTDHRSHPGTSAEATGQHVPEIFSPSSAFLGGRSSQQKDFPAPILVREACSRADTTHGSANGSADGTVVEVSMDANVLDLSLGSENTCSAADKHTAEVNDWLLSTPAGRLTALVNKHKNRTRPTRGKSRQCPAHTQTSEVRSSPQAPVWLPYRPTTNPESSQHLHRLINSEAQPKQEGRPHITLQTDISYDASCSGQLNSTSGTTSFTSRPPKPRQKITLDFFKQALAWALTNLRSSLESQTESDQMVSCSSVNRSMLSSCSISDVESLHIPARRDSLICEAGDSTLSDNTQLQTDSNEHRAHIGSQTDVFITEVEHMADSQHGSPAPAEGKEGIHGQRDQFSQVSEGAGSQGRTSKWESLGELDSNRTNSSCMGRLTNVEPFKITSDSEVSSGSDEPGLLVRSSQSRDKDTNPLGVYSRQFSSSLSHSFHKSPTIIMSRISGRSTHSDHVGETADKEVNNPDLSYTPNVTEISTSTEADANTVVERFTECENDDLDKLPYLQTPDKQNTGERVKRSSAQSNTSRKSFTSMYRQNETETHSTGSRTLRSPERIVEKQSGIAYGNNSPRPSDLNPGWTVAGDHWLLEALVQKDDDRFPPMHPEAGDSGGVFVKPENPAPVVQSPTNGDASNIKPRGQRGKTVRLNNGEVVQKRSGVSLTSRGSQGESNGGLREDLHWPGPIHASQQAAVGLSNNASYELDGGYDAGASYGDTSLAGEIPHQAEEGMGENDSTWASSLVEVHAEADAGLNQEKTSSESTLKDVEDYAKMADVTQAEVSLEENAQTGSSSVFYREISAEDSSLSESQYSGGLHSAVEVSSQQGLSQEDLKATDVGQRPITVKSSPNLTSRANPGTPPADNQLEISIFRASKSQSSVDKKGKKLKTRLSCPRQPRSDNAYVPTVGGSQSASSRARIPDPSVPGCSRVLLTLPGYLPDEDESVFLSNSYVLPLHSRPTPHPASEWDPGEDETADPLIHDDVETITALEAAVLSGYGDDQRSLSSRTSSVQILDVSREGALAPSPKSSSASLGPPRPSQEPRPSSKGFKARLKKLFSRCIRPFAQKK